MFRFPETFVVEAVEGGKVVSHPVHEEGLCNCTGSLGFIGPPPPQIKPVINIIMSELIKQFIPKVNLI